jgi:flagellar hook assembly protein FlgD
MNYLTANVFMRGSVKTLLIAIFLLAVFIIQPSTLTASTHVSGRISNDTVWSLKNHPYIVDSTVFVYSDSPDKVVTLTVEAGVEIRFKDRTYLQVGRGENNKGCIIAKGRSEKPITFTAVSQNPGAWRGIYFADGTVDEQSILNHCIVEYGGYRLDGNIYIENCAPIITNCTIQNGSKHGIRMNNHEHSKPRIKDNTIKDNAGNGIHTDGNQPTPLISGNTISKNKGHPIVVGAHVVSRIDENNRINDNGNNSIYVMGDLVRGTHTWKVNVPCIISGHVYVYGEADKDAASLELLPGTTLQFTDKSQFQVGRSWREKGILFARGTPQKPIMFTAVSKTPGAWRGIYFADGAVDGKIILNHCIVEYGGYRLNSNIHIETCSPVISNCIIRNGSQHGIRMNDHPHCQPQISGNTIIDNSGNGISCDGNKPTPMISANSISKNKGYAIAIGAHAVSRIDENNRISDNGNNGIYVRGDLLRGTHTWKVNAPCIIGGHVYVYGELDKDAASLELLPGTILQFASKFQFQVGHSWRQKGILIARGTTQKPITFSAVSKTPGAWRGIYFADGAVDGENILNHCIVEYAGDRINGNIYIENCSPVISNCIIGNGGQHGIRMNDHPHCRPQISGNTITGNSGNGVSCDGSKPTPMISANTISKNNGYAVAIGAHAVTRIDGNNRVSDNGNNGIYVRGDLLRGTHTWKVNVPCIIGGHVFLYGEADKEAASLELLPGTTLQFAGKFQFQVGHNWKEKGVLIARGMEQNPITFTAVTKSPGAWRGIYFADGAVDGENILNHCIVEYAGDRLSGNIFIETCSPVISNCTIQKGSRYGIRLNDHPHCQPQIIDNIITDNNGHGISSDGSRPTPLISGNIIDNNNGYAIVTGAHAVSRIDENNRISDNTNNSIYVLGDLLRGHHTWKVGVPCFIIGHVYVYGEADKEPASMELLPGTTLQFANKIHLRIGNSWKEKGILIAKGTRDKPITFTARSQAPGAWRGIYLSDGAVDGKNILDHCIVEYGGSRLQGNIQVDNASLTIANSIIRKSSTYGIYANNSFTGVYCSNIIDNARGGIYHQGKGSASAEYVWWGDPSGPSGSGPGIGASVSQSVDWDPWLTQPIDANPDLYIRNITLSPGIFSNKGGSAHFQVFFSSPAQWKITISDPDNQPVKEENGTGSFIDWKWMGKNNQGTALKNGTYKFALESKGNSIVAGRVEIRDTVPLADIGFPDFSRIVKANSDIKVKGTAKGQNFKSYILEYGQGCHPASWTLLRESTKPVDNAALSKKPFHIPTEKNYMGVLRLRVKNAANEQTVVKRYIDIMEMEKISAQNQFFSPNNDKIKDQTVINAHLNFSNQWQVKIMSGIKKKSRKSRKRGALSSLRTFTGFGRIISQPWDGKDEQGNAAPDGPYRYEVSVLHPISGKTVLVKETLGTVDTAAPSIEISSPVSGAIIADTHTVRGTAADKHFSRWQMDLGAGETPEKWKQIYESEQAVSNGTLMKLDTQDFKQSIYTLRLQSWDRAGNYASLHRAINVFNLRGPMSSYLFSPNGDGMLDVAPLDNSLTLPGDWKIAIVHVNTPDKILREYKGSGEAIDQSWDGKGNAGQTVKDGVYIAELQAVPVGRQFPRITRDLLEVSVDNTPPRLEFHHPVKGGNLFNIAPLRVTVDDTNLLEYTLSRSEKDFFDLFYRLFEGNKAVQNTEVCSWNTYNHPNGNYTMQLTARDRAFNRKVLTIPFRVDNIVISNVSNTPVFFDPIKGEKTQIKYEIDRDAFITIDMLQRDPVHGKILAVKATPYREAKRKKGMNSDPWDGKGDNNKLLPLTYYPYRITAKKDKRIQVYETPFITGMFEPGIGGAAFIVPNIGMTPTSDGLAITFKLQKNTRVDVQVGQYRKEGYLHHLMRDAPVPAGEHEVTWNLRNEKGKLLRPGQGRFQLSIAVKGIPLPDPIAVTRSRASAVKNVRVNNLLIQPNYGETASLHYTLEEDVDSVTVNIVDPNGNHFRGLEGPAVTGSHEIAWDGRDDKGLLANLPGDYRYSLKVTRAGKKDTVRKGIFVLRGHYQFDASGVYQTPELVIIEVRDDQGQLIGIETEEKQKK